MNEDTGITINGDVIINFNEPSVDTGKSVQKLRLTNDSKKWKKRIKARDMNCQCCGEKYDQSWSWWVCDTCGYRICPKCFTSFKCPQCSWGHFQRKSL